MSNTKHVQRPMIFNQNDLDALIQTAEQEYRNSLNACHRLNKPVFALFCEELIKLHDQGYTIHQTLPASAGRESYSIYLTKPEALQADDLEQIRTDVEAKYLQSIEDHNKTQIELLTKQLYDQEQAKELRKQQEKESKQRAQAAADAQEYFNTIIEKETK